MILLVSPDAAFARAYAHQLAIARHRTVTVGTTAEALAHLARLRFDVILLDAELADEQVWPQVQPRTPTILLLNHTSLDDVLAAVDAIAPADAPIASRA